MPMNWAGVLPAITTPFLEDLTVDHQFLARHARWLVENGCAGIVALGSLGEGQTLSFEEKRAILETCAQALGGQTPLVAGVSALSTAEAVRTAAMAEQAGASGLMVLPPYVYQGDWPEMRSHVKTVIDATPLPCMLYNNPVAYGVDFTPLQVHELLALCPNLKAIKESSADVRRVAALRALMGSERLQILVGVDDMIVESIATGAVGWVAGLVNAFPRESVELFERAQAGDREGAFALYSWFLPLLRLDTVPKFVQLIKFVQEQVGVGTSRVRPPRLPLMEAERRETETMVRRALGSKPQGSEAAAAFA